MTTLNWKTNVDKLQFWARAPRALGGRYVISLVAGEIWNVNHRKQRGKMRRQLGFAYTPEEAKALVQADNDKKAAAIAGTRL
jgi:hypothetical protein